ncbi:hypothetical protein [Szabonella alba]|uniref:Uncharacterized protein n=1 Tax=Szabonella alba TaxID=2804194 RepID=A0A8K0XZU8_9RHOB|nr:hypothetical protein [Szabonella alba]MBL4917176.1 hypothetical protein [Szabonella alba]
MPNLPISLLLALLMTASCGTFPDLGEDGRSLAAPGPAPVLVPVEDLLALDTAPRARASGTGAVEARADRLRNRAAALRRTEVTQD